MSQEKSLNRQIAELLGYTCKARTPGGHVAIIDPDGRELEYTSSWLLNPDLATEKAWQLAFDDERRVDTFWLHPQSRLIPMWTSDLNHALRLLDTLPQELWVDIQRGYSNAQRKMCWHCSIETAGAEKLGRSDRCDTQAEAICQAFIDYMVKQKASQPS